MLSSTWCSQLHLEPSVLALRTPRAPKLTAVPGAVRSPTSRVDQVNMHRRSRVHVLTNVYHLRLPRDSRKVKGKDVGEHQDGFL